MKLLFYGVPKMNAFNHSELASLLKSQYDSLHILEAEKVLDIILSRRFGVAYKPIVEVQSGEISGHEASAQFWTQQQVAVNPGTMFAYLDKNPLLLFHTEFEMKKLQITHAPESGLLMLNMNIDGFFEGDNDASNPFLLLFKEHAWSERELIINIVQNHHMADACRSQRIIEMLQQTGTSVALEDIGLAWGMFSLSAFMDARIIKFNSTSLQKLNQKAAQAMVDWLVSTARRMGVDIVMNGIDNCDQFEWAKRMGVDYVQGRLFERHNLQIRQF